MNGRSASPPPPSPGPLCAVYTPLLPLLNARALPPEQETSLREHLADCVWCQNQLAAYAVVEDALRQRYGSLSSAQPLTMGDIARAREARTSFAMPPVKPSHATNRKALRTVDLSDSLPDPLPDPLPDSTAPWDASPARRSPRHPGPWRTLGAVAAAFLVVLLAAALFAQVRPRTPGSAQAACATALHGAGPASSVSGFAGVPLPTGAVMTAPKTSFGGPSQFTVAESDVCYSGSSAPTPNPTSSGWTYAHSFPYQGALLQYRGQSQPACASLCFQLADSRYLALEQMTDHGGGVFTYHLRLATPPPAPACNANFANSPLKGVQIAVEDVSLPPITYAVPNNAANLHGYDLCSSGTAASISAFLSSALPSTGWTKVATNARCFYSDQCWTRDLDVISWRVDDPADWHIAYLPATR